MSCDLLPEWLNEILDDVETNLCLPILLIMIVCTIQFIINHVIDIGCTIYLSIVQNSSENEGEVVEKEPGESLLDKIKGYVCNLITSFDNTDSKPQGTATPQEIGLNSREEEWDYCEEDDD